MTVEEKLQEAREFLASEIEENMEGVMQDLLNRISEEEVIEDIRNNVDVLQIPHDMSYDSPDAYVSIEKINQFDYSDGILLNVLKYITIDNKRCKLMVQTQIEKED